MSILGIDHVEFYVADLRSSVASFCGDYGFTQESPRELGDSPGSRSVLLRQGTIALLLTAAIAPGHPAEPSTSLWIRASGSKGDLAILV